MAKKRKKTAEEDAPAPDPFEELNRAAPRIVPPEECPNRIKHTPMPDTIAGKVERQRELQKTHNQTKCPTCGNFVIWRPKRD